jgi:hypothetical protein
MASARSAEVPQEKIKGESADLVCLPLCGSHPATTAVEEPRVLPSPCPCCGGRMIIIETFARPCQPSHRPTLSIPAAWPRATTKSVSQAFEPVERTRSKAYHCEPERLIRFGRMLVRMLTVVPKISTQISLLPLDNQAMRQRDVGGRGGLIAGHLGSRAWNSTPLFCLASSSCGS